jgi:hypothetical protein
MPNRPIQRTAVRAAIDLRRWANPVVRSKKTRKIVGIAAGALALWVFVSWMRYPEQYQFEYISSDGEFSIIELPDKGVVDFGATGGRRERKIDRTYSRTHGGTFAIVEARFSEYSGRRREEALSLHRVTSRDWKGWMNFFDLVDQLSHPRWQLPLVATPVDPIGGVE